MNSCLLYVFQVHVLLFPLFRFYRSSVAFIVIEFLHVSVLVCMFVRLLSSFTGWNMELDNWRVGRQDGFLSLLLFFFFFYHIHGLRYRSHSCVHVLSSSFSLFASVEVSLDIQMKHEIAVSDFPKNTLAY